MKKVFVMLAAGLLPVLAGCATSSGVLEMGDGVYTISTHKAVVRGGMTSAKREALQEASSYCRQMGKRVSVVKMETTPHSSFHHGGDAELVFTCK